MWFQVSFGVVSRSKSTPLMCSDFLTFPFALLMTIFLKALQQESTDLTTTRPACLLLSDEILVCILFERESLLVAELRWQVTDHSGSLVEDLG